MDAILKTILEAPLPNLLIFAGLIFVGLSVLGGISGKLEPGKQGRIAAGVIGALLMLIGIYLSVSGAGIPQAARTVATSPLEAPLPNVLIVAGLLFVGIGVLGGISGKFEPDRQGRIAAGGVGGLLLLIGFVMVFRGASASQATLALTPSPAPVAVVETTSLPAALPSPAPSATALPSPLPVPSATPLPAPIVLPTSTAAPASVSFVPRRDVSVTVAANGDIKFDEIWALQFGPRATRIFGLTFQSGSADRKLDAWAISEGDVPYAEKSGQADNTFDVLTTPAADGSKRYDVRWYFPATANLTRTFGLHFISHGPLAVAGDGRTVLAFRSLGPGRQWTVGSTRVDIRLPRMVDQSQLFAQALWDGVAGAGAQILDGQNIAFTGQNIAPDRTLDIQVRYPSRPRPVAKRRCRYCRSGSGNALQRGQSAGSLQVNQVDVEATGARRVK